MRRLFAVLAFLALRPVPPSAAAPEPPSLVLLATRGTEPRTGVYVVPPGTARLPPPIAVVEHLPDAAVRGALVPGRDTVLVVADRAPVRDHSFDASLLRVEPGRAALPLCDRVDHASRPLVTAGGRVFVARGRPGPARPDGYRIDELTVDEVDLASGATRVVFSGRGQHVSVQGAVGGELVLYLVGATDAALLAAPMDGGAPRTIVSGLAPFARDFTVDGARVIFQTRDEARRDLWVIDRVDVRTGARERLVTAAVQHLAPFAWPGGDVAYDAGRGLALLRGGLRAPAGAGPDVVRAVAADGRRAAAWHYRPGEQHPDVLILDAAARLVERIPAPRATRLEIVGFRSAP